MTEGAALARFLRYREAAADLERRKALPARGGADAEAMLADEEALDRAWAEVERVAGAMGRWRADVLARHYLMGDCWRDVSAFTDLPLDLLKKEAYKALGWLDAHPEG